MVSFASVMFIWAAGIWTFQTIPKDRFLIAQSDGSDNAVLYNEKRGLGFQRVEFVRNSPISAGLLTTNGQSVLDFEGTILSNNL